MAGSVVWFDVDMWGKTGPGRVEAMRGEIWSVKAQRGEACSMERYGVVGHW